MPVVDPYQANMSVDTYAFMVTLAPPAGAYCYARDVKSFFLFNGTNWVAGVSGSSAPPTAAAGTGAGTGATIALAGNNKDGKITFTQGTGGVASGPIMTLTLAGGVSLSNPITITFSAGNANFAGVSTNIYCTTTTSSATLYLNGLALTAGNQYIGYYHIGSS